MSSMSRSPAVNANRKFMNRIQSAQSFKIKEIDSELNKIEDIKKLKKKQNQFMMTGINFGKKNELKLKTIRPNSGMFKTKLQFSKYNSL